MAGHRQVIDRVLWRLRTEAPWLARWEADGTWDRLPEHVQVHDHAMGRVEWTVSVNSTMALSFQPHPARKSAERGGKGKGPEREPRPRRRVTYTRP